MRNHRLTLAKFFGIVLAIAAPFWALAADIGPGAKITTGTPVMLQAPDAGATPLTTDQLQSTAQSGAAGARLQVSASTPTLMTAGIAGSRKAISLQNFDTTQSLCCGFVASVTCTTSPFKVPPQASSIPGSWQADLGLNAPVYCIASTSTQTSPNDTGVAEVK